MLKMRYRGVGCKGTVIAPSAGPGSGCTKTPWKLPAQVSALAGVCVMKRLVSGMAQEYP